CCGGSYSTCPYRHAEREVMGTQRFLHWHRALPAYFSAMTHSPLHTPIRVLLLCLLLNASSFAADLRIGIIGCDTSHVTAFTETLNNPDCKGHIAGGKVVAAFKGGSKDIPSSASRVEDYTKTLHTKYGVKIYDSIEKMCQDVDAVLLESVDGRPHLEQAKPVLKAHKPVFIDKPMAGSLADVIEIFRVAKEAKVPIFSSSALR